MAEKTINLIQEGVLFAERPVACFNCGKRIGRGQPYRQLMAYASGRPPILVPVCPAPCANEETE